MIQLKDIIVKFGDFEALHKINVHVKEGEFFTFLGPSGCGKTTTLRTITGFIEPVSGTVHMKGEDITHVPIEKRNIGIVFQSYALFPTMTVHDNIAFGLKIKKLKKAEIEEKVQTIARKVDLSDEQLAKAVSQLSGGQQQRVAIARALVTEPAIICMDEPLSNLDAKLRVQLRNELKNMQKEFGITTIYVTHDQEEAMAVSDRIAVMNGGVIQHVSNPKSIYQRPANLFVANFIGHSNTLNATADVKAGKLVFENGFVLDYDGFSEKAKDGKVKVSVRPEEFIIQKKDVPGVPATVKSSIFLGLMTTYFVELFSGETVEITDVSSISNILPNGTEVSLTFEAEKINVFTTDGNTSLTKGVVDDAHA